MVLRLDRSETKNPNDSTAHDIMAMVIVGDCVMLSCSVYLPAMMKLVRKSAQDMASPTLIVCRLPIVPPYCVETDIMVIIYLSVVQECFSS